MQRNFSNCAFQRGRDCFDCRRRMSTATAGSMGAPACLSPTQGSWYVGREIPNYGPSALSRNALKLATSSLTSCPKFTGDNHFEVHIEVTVGLVMPVMTGTRKREGGSWSYISSLFSVKPVKPAATSTFATFNDAQYSSPPLIGFDLGDLSFLR